MKVTWTTSRDRIALIPPTNLRDSLQNLYNHADRLRNGYVTITIETVKKARSTGYKSQNHAINGYIGQIAKDTGEETAVIKLHCKTLAVRRGYPLKEENGELIYSKITGEPIPESEANISTEEAGFLIEEIIQLAAELGIRLENL